MSGEKNLFFKRQLLNILMLCASDSVVLLAGLYLGNWIIYLIHGLPISIQYAYAVIPVWCIGAVAARVVPAWGIGAVEEFRRIQLLLIVVFGIAGIVVFMSRGQIIPSRIVYGVSYTFSAVFIPLLRIPVKRALLMLGQWGCQTAIYGGAAQVAAVIDDFMKNPTLGYVPSAVFTDDLPCGAMVDGVPVAGALQDAGSTASVAIAPVSLAEDFSLSERFDRVFSSYQRVVLLPDIKEDVFLWALPRTLGSLIGLEVTSNLLNPLARIIKRGIDLGLVIIFAPVWVPLLIFTSILLLCADRQNPFFLQHRVGKGNRPFRPVKFRTMVGNAEEVLEKALLNDESLRTEWEAGCKLRNDPRVTRTGKFLRRTSLDELPQVLNVLSGQMSLVGPRPLPDYHHQQLAEFARTPRVRVRPGITGLWQVSGRSDSGNAGMEKWDTYYVRNWSLWLDIIILARTVSAVIVGKGAY
jgi:Undecaprenyl-phosphate galactose phosphotransferase WbaP